jgi:hypothetical protein
MIALLGELSRNLLVIIFINVLLEMLMPEGQYHRYIRMITGLIVVLMVVNTMSLILGRAPAAGVLLPQAVPAALRVESAGGDVSRITREQALALYRESLKQLAREEVESGGQWKLVSARFTLEEDSSSEQYGTIYRVELQVQAAGGGSGEVEPVRIGPVSGEGGAEGEGAGGQAAQRVPELEQALARRIHVSPGLVSVIESR